MAGKLRIILRVLVILSPAFLHSRPGVSCPSPSPARSSCSHDAERFGHHQWTGLRSTACDNPRHAPSTVSLGLFKSALQLGASCRVRSGEEQDRPSPCMLPTAPCTNPGAPRLLSGRRAIRSGLRLGLQRSCSQGICCSSPGWGAQAARPFQCPMVSVALRTQKPSMSSGPSCLIKLPGSCRFRQRRLWESWGGVSYRPRQTIAPRHHTA